MAAETVACAASVANCLMKCIQAAMLARILGFIRGSIAETWIAGAGPHPIRLFVVVFIPRPRTYCNISNLRESRQDRLECSPKSYRTMRTIRVDSRQRRRLALKVRPFAGEYLPLGPEHNLVEPDVSLGWLIRNGRSLDGRDRGLQWQARRHRFIPATS
jgi:hypothetical protein